MRNTLKDATELIKQVAGKRRERILDEHDLLQVLQEAQSEVWGLRTGGTVANTYRYPAYRMTIVAVRKSNGDYAVWIDLISARKGTSPLPDNLPRQYRKSNEAFGEILRTFADSEESRPDIILKASEVNPILRQRRAKAREKARAGIQWTYPDWNGRIIRADSINAGNCPQQTDKVIARMGVNHYTTANRLRTWVTRYAPTLAHYADRTINKAYERQCK
jgi:hypothetical protein